jgi:2-hydroxychromene-2-carboxylate isomerase
MQAAHPVFYFSLRSPYSWLALHDLRQTRPDLLAAVQLVPFWEPDADYQAQLSMVGSTFLYHPMSREKHLYILADVRRLAARRGLRPMWPLDRAPRWEVPHLAWIVADMHGHGLAFLERVTLARWQEGADICDPDVIARLGSALGMDPNALSSAHTDAAVREVGLTRLQDCIHTGVFGVPFFTVGREKFWGVDRLRDFMAAATGMPAIDLSDPLCSEDSPPAAILDHAGGCG